MIRVLAFVAILCGSLFVFGFLMADRVRITVHQKSSTAIDVIVTVPNVPKAHTLFLKACVADMAEDGVMFCAEDGWFIRSAHPMREDQRQYPFPFRNVPRGWLLFSAAVLDFDGKTLASGETRMAR